MEKWKLRRERWRQPISLESPEAETTVIEEGINDAAAESNEGDKDEPVAACFCRGKATRDCS